jgi:hypothetical protein
VVFVGEKGKICVDRGRFMAEPESLGQVDLAKLPVQLYRSTNHYRDFVECIRSRKPSHLRRRNRRAIGHRLPPGQFGALEQANLKWDPQAERFLSDAEANAWLDVAKRDPWKA